MSEAKRLGRLALGQIEEVLDSNHGTALNLCGTVVQLRSLVRLVQQALTFEDLDDAKRGLTNLCCKISEMEDHLAPELQALDHAKMICQTPVIGLEKHCAQLEGAVNVRGQHSINDPAVRSAVYALTGGRCAYCDCQLEPGSGTTETFTIEHIVPRESGGPDNIANYVPACKSCNCSKGTGHVITFIKRRVGFATGARPELRVVTGEAASGE